MENVFYNTILVVLIAIGIGPKSGIEHSKSYPPKINPPEISSDPYKGQKNNMVLSTRQATRGTKIALHVVNKIYSQ